MGATAGIIAWENDLSRVAASLAGFGAFSILQFIGLFRYRGSVDWTKPSAFLYGLMLLSVLLVSAVGLWIERRHGGRRHATS